MTSNSLQQVPNGTLEVHGKTYPKECLFYVGNDQNFLYLLVEETNCIVKFVVLGNKVYYEENKTSPIGTFTKN